jgi:5-bromo-4-chloroindolyl phosphate hydrolysis protein
MEKFDTMLSQRGQLLLIFEKYKFKKYRVLNTSEETVWRCTNKNCIATVYTLNSVFSRKEATHNHNLEEELLVRQKVSNSLKRQAQEDISAKPAKLIRKELNNQRDALETISITDFRYIRNNINRARLQLVPKLPRSAEEVQIFLNTANLKTSK